ncbi:MAG TPA: DMT family transporter [Hyphomonadaceae bacterium]
MTTASISTEHENRNRLIGVGLAAGGAGLFSLKGVVIKLAFAEGMSVSQLLTFRMAFALPVYLAVGVYAWLRATQKPSPKHYLYAAGLGIMSYYISSWLNFEGLRYVSAQLERLILYIYPTMVALMTWAFYKTEITRQHILALILA